MITMEQPKPEQNPVAQNMTTEKTTPKEKIHVSRGVAEVRKKFNALDSHDADKLRRKHTNKKRKLARGSQQVTDFFG